MTYTALALIAAAIALLLDLVILRTRIVLSRRYLIFSGLMIAFFLLVNGILTALPVVIYSSHAITGFRVMSIPIEDFVYLFALITPTVALYEYFAARRVRDTMTTQQQDGTGARR